MKILKNITKIKKSHLNPESRLFTLYEMSKRYLKKILLLLKLDHGEGSNGLNCFRKQT